MSENNLPLFSVLIANYNNEKYLLEAVESVKKQTYKKWEIIIVDDASTDNSCQIYDHLKNNGKIKVFINHKNKGCGYTKHRCIVEANGELCGFLDPDDVLDIQALEIMVQNHYKQPLHSIIYSTYYEWSSDIADLKLSKSVGSIPSSMSQLTYSGPRISHFATFKRKLYFETSGIHTKFKRAVDQDLYLKLEELGPTLFINKALYYYRQHANGISQGKNIQLARQYHLMAKFDAFHRRKKTNFNNLTVYEYLNYKIEYFNLDAKLGQSRFRRVISYLRALITRVVAKNYRWISHFSQ
ncbi:glycosyltransferase family 2 protein [Pontibacter burrus]|uniref:Glycosyltransferase n=1 Tax=Pontibacter burrus TaxID=2704466 RepID=A0A6B3LV72_9BACT|nr:glycosyltransferase [Pontibacter burrus]NEM98895.1 glycosyltransferase [Pontibacter burrus]